MGDCAAFSQRAREQATFAPNDDQATMQQLSAGAILGVPRDTLEEGIRALHVLGDRSNYTAWLHELYGELGDAAGALADVESDALARRDTETFSYARLARMTELYEAGGEREVAQLGLDYGTRLVGLPPPEDDEVDGNGLVVLSMLVQQGRASADQLAARREAFLAAKKPEATPARMLGLWASAYARPALDAKGAREAFSALPSFSPSSPVPRKWWSWDLKEAVARTFVLAGQPDARAFVDAALSDCTPNFYGTRARYWSGLTYETAGDLPSACGEYARVLSRWGHATPRSITADASRERMRVLKCPAPDGG
jgi:hypothetical protein